MKHGLAVRSKPLGKLQWQPLDKKQIDALNDLKEKTSKELEGLLVLYDPEATGLIGLSDFYLLLKECFINNKEILLYMNKPTENIFEEEGSYKELMRKLDALMFEEIALCKKMYQKAKNVSIEFSMFWMIVGALLQTGILKMSFDKRKIVRLAYKAPPVKFADDDESFEERAKKLIKRIETQIANDNESLEEKSNQSQPDLENNRNVLEHNRSMARSSQSQPPQSKKILKLPTAITEQLEKNKSKERLDNSLSRADSNINFIDNARENSSNKLKRQDTSKRNLILEEVLGPTPPKRSENSFLTNMQCIPESVERQDSHDIKDLKKQLNNPSKINTILLKNSECIWKRALAEIFCFYNKLQKQNKAEYSFENFKEKMNHMSLGEWMKFCNDFELSVEKPITEIDSQKEFNRKYLTALFKKEAKGTLGINYPSFEVTSVHKVYFTSALLNSNSRK